MRRIDERDGGQTLKGPRRSRELQSPGRVLLAEDDTEMRRLLASALRRDGYDVVEARSGSELMHLIRSVAGGGESPAIDVIVSDVRMPGISGLDVLADLREGDWATPVILITAFGDLETHAEADRLGAAAVFDKPFDLQDLRTAVGNLARPR